MIHGCDNSRFRTSSKKLLQLTGFSSHKVNGLYRIREERVGYRASWISDRGMVLWFNERHCWWMVGPKSKVKSDKCYVYCCDNVDDPTRVTGRWKYFDSKAVGGAKFKEELFASVVKADRKSVQRRAQMAPVPVASRGGHRRTQSFAIPDEAREYALSNERRKRKKKNVRTYSQDFAGLDLYPYSPDRRSGRPDYVSRRRRQSSALGTFTSPHVREPRTTLVGRGSRHQRRISNDNSSERTMSSLHPTSPRSLSGKHLRTSSRTVQSTRGRESPSTHRGLKGSRHHQQDGFSRQQQQASIVPKGSSHKPYFDTLLDFTAQAGTMVSPATSLRRARTYPQYPRLREYVGLKAKHRGGIFVTKYPFSPKLFSWPKKIRVEIGFIEDERPAVKWRGKGLYFDDIRSVTIGIKSNTFRRFENRIMRKDGVQPNQCVSVHGDNRTLDVVLKSSDDAKDFKRYLEINIKHPSMLLKE